MTATMLTHYPDGTVSDVQPKVEWGHPNYIQAYPCGHQLLLWWDITSSESRLLPTGPECPCCYRPIKMPNFIRRWVILAPDSGKRGRGPIRQAE